MVLPGHLAGGYIVATAFLALAHPDLSLAETNALLIIGTLAGELPDMDLIFFNIKYRHREADRNDSHRNYATHIPAFWLAISLAIAIGGFLSGSAFIECAGWMVLLGTWSHFALDSIEYGIRWLSPLSERRFSLKRRYFEKPSEDRPGSLMQYAHFLIGTYWKTATFWTEIVVTLFAAAIFFRSFH